MKNIIKNLLGFERINITTVSNKQQESRGNTLIQHIGDYQSKMFSSNNVIQKKNIKRLLDVSELLDILLNNSAIRNKIILDDKKVKNSTPSIRLSDIFNLRSGTVKYNSIYVMHPSRRDDVYQYSDEKAIWQMKTRSVILYDEKIPKHSILVLNLKKKFKNFLRIKNVNVEQYYMQKDYDYINNIRTPLILHKSPREILEEEVECNRSSPHSIAIKTKRSFYKKLEQDVGNAGSMFAGVEDENVAEKKALDAISTKIEQSRTSLDNLKSTLKTISANNGNNSRIIEIIDEIEIDGIEKNIIKNENAIKELYKEYEERPIKQVA